MSLPKNNVTYHDLSSLQNIRSQSQKDEPGALRQAAEQFEAIFMNMLLSSMRKANEAFEAEGLMNSQTTKFYQDMQDSQMATELAKNGSLGLADLLVQQLSPQVVKTKSTPAALSDLQTLMQRKQVKAPVINEVSPTESIGKTAENPDWQVDNPVDFVKQLLPAARNAASAIGMDPLALIAQAALETGWGKRMIKTAAGDNSFNLFGIKANHGWQGDTAVVDTLEYRQGVARKELAKFRAYESPEHSLSDYISFVTGSSRYQDAVSSASDPQAYFEQLQAAGYATDPEYARKVMSVYQGSAFEQVRAEFADAKEINDVAE
ncbi:flagellar assembly peptidoglycan hydrolase FlgJ [Chromatiaceae bacterium AAb-1]|nr:flagellar assembly peptidoglycan hydrolase FlgJ [Chromatiaceae bacterium AAb-1]